MSVYCLNKKYNFITEVCAACSPTPSQAAPPSAPADPALNSVTSTVGLPTRSVAPGPAVRSPRPAPRTPQQPPPPQPPPRLVLIQPVL